MADYEYATAIKESDGTLGLMSSVIINPSVAGIEGWDLASLPAAEVRRLAREEDEAGQATQDVRP